MNVYERDKFIQDKLVKPRKSGCINIKNSK